MVASKVGLIGYAKAVDRATACMRVDHDGGVLSPVCSA